MFCVVTYFNVFLFFSSYLRELFRNLFHKQGFTYDYVFDWNMLKFGGPQQDSEAHGANNGAGGDHKDRNKRRYLRQPQTPDCVGGETMPGLVNGGGVGVGGGGGGAEAMDMGHKTVQQMAPPEVPSTNTGAHFAVVRALALKILSRKDQEALNLLEWETSDENRDCHWDYCN